ncbi:MAG: electron transport complex subunit RsxG [Candidatus Dactylopiibacterium carminicum]|uniref:Ion-translocating oxidoreductase complex subunit G n=1 Tax=Candidatus Dactylopiibacterium carminicum TaxID=857335 RepID=A0A272EYD2_9RHOO|nr:electron transport complex subunit RsxG [Candidatus Dactylopiibacterium carminicum]KAF7600425.1 electron transport complex subunit RsxG [Candidatus Dactylopiibacterium carminicum]PAS95046.1 MAG: electron transport complex subunit RsxG [Candidatus Dactylopiibacterium carminicum]PAS97845.1 MAG: electron transport complex subunit RsxG [Candidatus Dactylopiibacterium carminicum]PAT00424.1 MAG: electron transporter RnfG [Candidatus Dactylopiibacterium carminicum]
MQLALLRERIPYQAGTLAACLLITSAALVFSNQLTAPAIERAARADLQSSLTQVLPEGMVDNDMLRDARQILTENGASVTVYRGSKAGQYAAAVFESSAIGYAGEIRVLIGVDAGGTVMGVRVLKHAETPGLGDKIEIAKAGWIRGFEHKSLQNLAPERWAVKKDGGIFDQFAGATITPHAVVKAVKLGLDFYAAHANEIAGE